MDFAKRHLQGHVGYYAVSGNTRSVSTYAYRISHLFYWLRVSWDGCRPLIVSLQRSHWRWPILTLIRLELRNL